MSSDFELLDAWGGGDKEAGNELFKRHFRSVYGFLRNKVSQGSEDLIQQTFLRCVEGKDRFERRSSFRAYLFGTARNVLYETIRKRRRNAAEPDFESQSLIDLSPTPSKILVEKRDRRMLLEAMRRIPLDYQVALELYHWEGMTGPQLAEILGLSEPGVRSRLRRATDALRKQLTELAESADQLNSTLAGLTDWAAEMREHAARGAAAAEA